LGKKTPFPFGAFPLDRGNLHMDSGISSPVKGRWPKAGGVYFISL